MEEKYVKHIHEHYNKDADSIEIGTPGKGGTVKVYGDFTKPDEFREKIKKAMEVRKFAQAEIEAIVD